MSAECVTLRRQYAVDGPNNRSLWVLACMDERLPVDEALGIRADSPVGADRRSLFQIHQPSPTGTDGCNRSGAIRPTGLVDTAFISTNDRRRDSGKSFTHSVHFLRSVQSIKIFSALIII